MPVETAVGSIGSVDRQNGNVRVKTVNVLAGFNGGTIFLLLIPLCIVECKRTEYVKTILAVINCPLASVVPEKLYDCEDVPPHALVTVTGQLSAALE